MRKITNEDFKLYSDRVNKSGSHFCGNCGRPVTSSDCCEDGYTNCCNQPAICREDFLKSGFIVSINNYLDEISSEPNEYRMYTQRQRPFNQVIVTPNKPYGCDNPTTFKFDNWTTVSDLVRIINGAVEK